MAREDQKAPPAPPSRRWRGDPSGRTAVVRPGDRTTEDLRALVRQGFAHARTGALSHSDAAPLLKRGWTVAAHLHLLRHDLKKMPGALAPRAHRLRRATGADLPAVTALDDSAFPPEWRLGRSGLTDALRATPHRRFRTVRVEPGIAAYAICGRAGREGYVQRLAVHEGHRGQGLGRALTLDGLRWLRRWRATSASVNTYVGNDVALQLYRSLGFTEVRPGLMVLTIEL